MEKFKAYIDKEQTIEDARTFKRTKLISEKDLRLYLDNIAEDIVGEFFNDNWCGENCEGEKYLVIFIDDANIEFARRLVGIDIDWEHTFTCL